MVTLEELRKVIEAAERKASEIRQPMNSAVVDEGGNLVSHVRMRLPVPSISRRTISRNIRNRAGNSSEFRYPTRGA